METFCKECKRVYLTNPFMFCTTCAVNVTGYILPTEHEHDFMLIPCGHTGSVSSCPTWSPVDGCQCIDHLGKRDHKMQGRAL